MEESAMKYVVDRLSQAKSEADRQEFLRGLLGQDKPRAGLFVASVVSGYLLTRAVRKK